MQNHYHLAEGVILNIGSRWIRLTDLKSGRRADAPDELLGKLEALATTGLPELDEDLQRFVQEGLVGRGEGGPDAFLRRRMAQLDEEHFGLCLPKLSARERQAYERVLEAHSARKILWAKIGQCPVLPETALRRALLVGDAEQVGNKRVLCFGDDDLVSLALATLGHEVVSVDMDDTLLAAVSAHAARHGLAITTHQYDARDPVPDDLGRFDVLLTDPMSNRACFELFLSRGLALLSPEGTGYVAVYPAASRLFAEVAQDLGLAIERTYRKHNRYYTTLFQLESYESDWVRVRKTAAFAPRPPPTEFAMPKDLYQEDIATHPTAVLSFYDGIAEPRFTEPLFLEMFVDLFAQTAGLVFVERHLEMAQRWTVIHGTTRDGFFILHADRDARQLCCRLRPYTTERDTALRDLLMLAYKADGITSGQVIAGRSLWDFRVA